MAKLIYGLVGMIVKVITYDDRRKFEPSEHFGILHKIVQVGFHEISYSGKDLDASINSLVFAYARSYLVSKMNITFEA